MKLRVTAGSTGMPGPVVVDNSVLRHDPYADAAVSSCERSGSIRGSKASTTQSTFAVLEVRTAPDPASAERVLQEHLANRYPRGTEITELPTEAGTAYVAEIGATEKWPWRTRSVHIVVGPYELQLAAVAHDAEAGHLSLGAELDLAFEHFELLAIDAGGDVAALEILVERHGLRARRGDRCNHRCRVQFARHIS